MTNTDLQNSLGCAELQTLSCDAVDFEMKKIQDTLMTIRASEETINALNDWLEKAKAVKDKCETIPITPLAPVDPTPTPTPDLIPTPTSTAISATNILSKNLKPIVGILGIIVIVLLIKKLSKK